MNASDIFAEVQYELADPDGDEFDSESLLRPLNNALRYISSKSRSIQHEIALAVVEGQYAYGIVEDLLSISGAKIQDASRGGDTPPFLPLTRATLNETDLLGVNYLDTPQFYTQWGRAQFHRTLSTTVEVVFTPDNLPVGYDYPPGSTGEAVFPTPATPAQVGDTILNITDDLSECEILAIHDYGSTTQTLVSHGPITRGMRNTIEVGDNLRIVAQAYSNHSVLIAPAPDWTDAMGDESLRLMAALRHYEITQDDVDNGTDVLELDDELLESLKYRVCFYAANSESGIDSAMAKNFMLISNTEYADNIDRVRKRVSDTISLWTNDVPRWTRPRTTGGGARFGNDFGGAYIR